MFGLGNLFSIICVSWGLTGPYNDACNKAFQAGAIQSGFQAQYDMVSNGLRDQALNQSRMVYRRYIIPTTGEQIWIIGGAIYKVTSDRSISYTLHPRPYVQDVSFTLSVDHINLGLAWHF